MPELSTIYDYMRANGALLGARILQEFPALHQFADPVSPGVEGLLRRPFPAQTIAIMGLAKRWQQARTAMVVAECGTGKTLISLGAIHVHSEGRPFTALAMVPPHLVEKWAREAFLTLPGVRVFLIDDLRNGGDENKAHGVNEVRLRNGRIVREGFQTSLSELRLRRSSTTPRQRWLSLCGRPSLFIVGRERAKLGYFWRHAYRVPRSGPYLGCVVNSDTGRPVIVDESRLTVAEFEKVKIAETVESRGDKPCRPIHSALWQADSGKILRMAPIEFIGRYMPGWFDYAICDEIHQLAGDTAQGNALGTLSSCTDRIVGLTGTLLGGYADDLFNTLFRLEAARMKEHGYEWGTTGRSSFTQDYGVLEDLGIAGLRGDAINTASSGATIGVSTSSWDGGGWTGEVGYAGSRKNAMLSAFFWALDNVLPLIEMGGGNRMSSPLTPAFQKLSAENSLESIVFQKENLPKSLAIGLERGGGTRPLNNLVTLTGSATIKNMMPEAMEGIDFAGSVNKTMDAVVDNGGHIDVALGGYDPLRPLETGKWGSTDLEFRHISERWGPNGKYWNSNTTFRNIKNQRVPAPDWW
jgi:hypothetical protein